MRRSLLTLILLFAAVHARSKTIDASSFLLPTNGPALNAHYFDLDSAGLWSQLAGESRVELSGIVIDGKSLSFDLKRAISPVQTGTQIVIGSTQGDRAITMPSEMMLRGFIVGEQHSSVVVCVVGKYLFASIRREDGETFDLAPERNGEKHILMRENDLLSLGESVTPNCFADDIPQPNALTPINMLLGGRGLSSNVPLNTSSLLQTDIAVEADTCFYHAAGSSIPKVAAYIYSMFGMSSLIYEDEANITLKVIWIKIWTDTDPYNVKGDAYALENLIVPYWKAHYANVPRDLAHVMTSIGYGGGGYGWFSLCDTNWAYSMSSPTTGGKYPTFAFTYDAYIVAHEIGHNFSLPHSHTCYWDPPLDTCFTKDDTSHYKNNGSTFHLILGDACDSLPVLPRPSAGTIMSYCASANYAFAGNDFSKFKLAMTFSPRVATVMRTNAEKAACIQTPDSAIVLLEYPRGGEVFKGDSIVTIKWGYAHAQLLNLQYSTNNGTAWAPIASNVNASDGSYAWTVPQANSTRMLVRIADASNDALADTSILNFQVIATAGVAATGPTGPTHSITLDESQNWLRVKPIDAPISFEIVNVLGNTALKGKTSGKIDIRNLLSGSYFIRFEDVSSTVLQFVKTK